MVHPNQLLKGSAFGDGMEWNGLNQSEKLLSICNIGHSHFAVFGRLFQTVTICNRFISLFEKSVF